MKKLQIKKRKRFRDMTIGNKLRFMSGLFLFVPLIFAVICIAILYIIFVMGDVNVIRGYFESVDNTQIAYEACIYMDSAYRKQLEETGDENILDIYPEHYENNGVLHVIVTKNGEKIYDFKSEEYEIPDNYDELLKLVENVQDNMFTISGKNIIFKSVIENNGNTYEVTAMGELRKISLYDKNAQLILQWFMVNVLFIGIVVLIVYLLTKFLHRTIFKRIEYSLNMLSDGVEKISSGDLDFRIDYDKSDEFKPICDSFNTMADHLKESVEMTQRQKQSQKEVLMSISHDIFSPLTSIKAYVEGIQNGIATTPEAQQKYLDVIKAKAEQIEKMVSELLFFSRLEYEHESNTYETIDLKEFIEEYTASVDNDYAVKNVQISISRCDEAKVYGNKSLTARMLTNIIDNSAKYSNKPVCHVDVSLTADTDECTLEISDDGPGVGEANLEHIFDIFFRSDAARQQTKQGSGIGLSTVSNIVQKSMHGRIHAENIPSGGLKIIIKLPLVKQ
ncbi:MAG: HAMP domain-containing histidine kinase [Faecalibacterium sp.]|nr:HAMP domain-containing histidine kinase [Ruminococcus sp.]MCM1393107.1 HAMP domain-containing histidine kinase [Ruminococcus sp.]MCM1485215.1 HAMP domain-containing histidine kinase [Faecalibacterium sp.]